MKDLFRRFSQKTSEAMGKPWAFILAVLAIVAWAVTGPIFDYSSTWQLVINTGTTIITFLMVFLIQNTQNRDSRATHIKLDELIRAIGKARNDLVDVEDKKDEELEKFDKEFKNIAQTIEEARVSTNGEKKEAIKEAVKEARTLEREAETEAKKEEQEGK